MLRTNKRPAGAKLLNGDTPLSSVTCGSCSSSEEPPLEDDNASPAEQPRVEDLGEVPKNAKPFCFVGSSPGVATPACKAGLRRGDAVISLGGATKLFEVQGELQKSLGQPLPVVVVDVHGRYLCKSVVPRVWDAFAPASLLGAELQDSCPLDLVASHPALSARPSAASARATSGRATSTRVSEARGGVPMYASAVHQRAADTQHFYKKPTGSMLNGRHRVDSVRAAATLSLLLSAAHVS